MEDWISDNYCGLYRWPSKTYFNKTDLNLIEYYKNSSEFLKATGYRRGLKNDWRYQLSTFVWDVEEGETIFAYKSGTFIGYGELGEYYPEDGGHFRFIEWKELRPSLDLNGTDLINVVNRPCTFMNIDDYLGEVSTLLKKNKIKF